jgi:hypothetical protein
MTCRAWEELLQQHLDGEPDGALQRHLLDCPHCAAQRPAIVRLLEGLSRLTPVPPPVALAGRIERDLITEARARSVGRWRVRAGILAGLAAAAALLLTIGLWSWKPPSRTPDDSVVQNPDPPPPLRESVTRAGDAVTTLTFNAAQDTSKQASTFIPAIKESTDPLTRTPTPVEPRIEQPLREATDGASNGLAPVADSARRAVSLFFRDLPLSEGSRQ